MVIDITAMRATAALFAPPPDWRSLCLRYAEMLKPPGEWSSPQLYSALMEIDNAYGVGRQTFTLLVALVAERVWSESQERDEKVVEFQKLAERTRGKMYRNINADIKQRLAAFNNDAVRNFGGGMLFGYASSIGMQNVSKRYLSPVLNYLSGVIVMNSKAEDGVDIETRVYQTLHERCARFNRKDERDKEHAVRLFGLIHATLQGLYPA